MTSPPTPLLRGEGSEFQRTLQVLLLSGEGFRMRSSIINKKLDKKTDIHIN